MYIPEALLNKKIKSPFRKEKTGSFLIFSKGGRIYHKDYGDGQFNGGCFDLVQSMYGLSYPQALERVAKDAGLVEGEDGSKKPRIKYEQANGVEEEKIPAIIHIKAWGKYRKEHLDYLAAYSLSPQDLDFCSDTKIYPVKEWALNRLRMPLDEGEPCFAYELSNKRGKWLKIYRPTKKGRQKWTSGIPFDEVMGLSCLKPCPILIISKSVKEALLIKKYLKLDVIVSQAENIWCFNEENIKLINSCCSNVYVSFDGDEPGKKASNALTKLTGWKHINVPDKYVSVGIKDWADLIGEYGVEPMIAHFKKKKLKMQVEEEKIFYRKV